MGKASGCSEKIAVSHSHVPPLQATQTAVLSRYALCLMIGLSDVQRDILSLNL
jgi:hypothetical protein